MALASLGLFRNQAKVEVAVHKRRRAPTALRCEPEPGQHAPRRLCITNTYSVGLVRDAICALAVRDNAPQPWHLPVAAETYDGWLSDSASFPVMVDLALAALDDAKGGPVAEGNVGGGTGMICHEFKGGTGTASRRVRVDGADYTVGALVQANYGARELLSVDGGAAARRRR